MVRHVVLTAIAVVTAATALPAATIVIDETSAGVAFDGIVDGFPGLAPKDGTGDFGGNPLSVVRKGDVTELRSVVEFPLGSLAAVAADRVAGATLRFNVDDVLSTLGPGTELIGQAADTILVHFYAGDGTATVQDYRRTAEAPLAVDTGAGAITDATLRRSGALFFTVDARARLLQALAEGSTHLGVLWRTSDTPTGTSLDDGRGGSASGEPSQTASGSSMPQLIVEVDDQPAPGCGNAGDGEACDDGDPCTTGDVCRDAACAGVSPCGDGAVDPACAEECDDGNRTPADGCSATCRYDSLTGGGGAAECLVSVAFARPVRDAVGAVAASQSCRDGDPACDGDPAAGGCGFDVAVCLGTVDARVAACAATASLSPALRKPGRSKRERANRERLVEALAAVQAPGCTASVRLAVPLRRIGTRLRPGKAKLVVRARPAAGRSDHDTVALACLPGS